MNTLLNAVATSVTKNVVLNDKAVKTSDKSHVAINAGKWLADMEAKRIAWEQGAYRVSNKELYALLADCLLFSGELPVAESKQRSAALETFFKERGLFFVPNVGCCARNLLNIFLTFKLH